MNRTVIYDTTKTDDPMPIRAIKTGTLIEINQWETVSNAHHVIWLTHGDLEAIYRKFEEVKL